MLERGKRKKSQMMKINLKKKEYNILLVGVRGTCTNIYPCIPLKRHKNKYDIVIVILFRTGAEKRAFHVEDPPALPAFKWSHDGKFFARMTKVKLLLLLFTIYPVSGEFHLGILSGSPFQNSSRLPYRCK